MLRPCSDYFLLLGDKYAVFIKKKKKVTKLTDRHVTDPRSRVCQDEAFSLDPLSMSVTGLLDVSRRRWVCS